MSRSYQRWTFLYDRRLNGEVLSPEELEELERLGHDEPAASHELGIRRQLLDLSCDLNGSDEAMVERVLATVDAREKVVPLRKPSAEPTDDALPVDTRLGSRRWRVPVLAVALASAAAMALMFAWPRAATETPAKARRIVRPTAVELTFTAGNVSIDGKRTTVSARALDPNSTLRVAQGRACLAINAQTDVCLDAHTTVVLDDQTGEQRSLRLVAGRVAAVLDKRPVWQSFSIVAGTTTATAIGTAFAVERSAQGSNTVTVMEGRVQVAASGRESRVVGASEQVRVDSARFGPTARTTRAEQLRHWALVEPRKLWQEPSVGIVHVETATAHALVMLDGTSLGSGPLSVVAASGAHRIALELDGRRLQQQQFRLTPGEERRVQLALPPATQPAQSPGVPVDPKAVRRIAPPGSAPPAESAEVLLQRARTLVSQGQWQGAAAAYQRLRAVHPKRPESHTVLVALGQLQLDRLGQPAQALASFDRYLRYGGGLAQEARFGKIRALRALGNRSGETQAIREYLSKYPASVDAAALKRRLASLD